MDYETLINNHPIEQKQLMCNFRTGETNAYRLKNKDISTSTNVIIHDAITPENVGVTMYDVSFLFDTKWVSLSKRHWLIIMSGTTFGNVAFFSSFALTYHKVP